MVPIRWPQKPKAGPIPPHTYDAAWRASCPATFPDDPTDLSTGLITMKLLSTFLSFRGRIGRGRFLFGLAVLAALSPFSISTIMSSNPLSELLTVIRRTGPVGLGWSLALLYVLAALMTKRLHDRGKSGLYAALFYLPAALQIARFFLGHMPEFARIASTSLVIAPWLGATGLWFLIELGFYKGQRGPNTYGLDPRQ